MHNIAARLAETPVAAGDKAVLTLQLFHVAGMEASQAFLYAGATNVILKTFEPRTLLQTIQDERATDVQIVPTTLAAIFALPDFARYDLSSLRRIVYAASPMPVALLRRGMEIWGPIFCQFYGQTESGPIITALSRDAHAVVDGTPEEQRILLSVGHPAPGVHVRIVREDGTDVQVGEVGEIIAQSRHLMVGYWRRPEETAATIVDGWLHTRDLGYFDERGYIYISGRQGDMIISGAENIMPREVEEVLYQHPAVSEAAVIGVPDPYWVERVHALVVLNGRVDATPEELIEFCKERLARYKAPKSLDLVDSLPKNASGKIDKLVLRQRFDQENAGATGSGQR
jgi:acyl-CoA synthetase (AMP-forming)/AMP-acid ligase II